MSKRAFLVGIDEFKEKLSTGEIVEREKWRLKGCVEDARHFSQLLATRFGFEDIRVLENSNATRKGIIEGLEWLLSDYEGGGTDVRVFHISSHGTYVEDQDGDETTDGKDEVIVPHLHDWNAPFRDDELGARFAKIPEDVNFTFIADCCHSGSIQADEVVELPPPPVVSQEIDENGEVRLVVSESMPPPQLVVPEEALVVDTRPAFPEGRFLYPPTVIENRIKARRRTLRSQPPELTREATEHRPKGRYGLRIVDRHALLAGSRADETAAERTHGGPRGVFSWALERVIEEHFENQHDAPLTYEKLLDSAGDLLEFERQEPQLECPAGWKTLGFLEPLGPNRPESTVLPGIRPGGNQEPPPLADGRREQNVSSNLKRFSEFLAEMGSHNRLMGRKKMRKSMEAAGLSEAEVALIKGGNAGKIEAYLAQGDGNGRPLPNQGPGG